MARNLDNWELDQDEIWTPASEGDDFDEGFQFDPFLYDEAIRQGQDFDDRHGDEHFGE